MKKFFIKKQNINIYNIDTNYPIKKTISSKKSLQKKLKNTLIQFIFLIQINHKKYIY